MCRPERDILNLDALLAQHAPGRIIRPSGPIIAGLGAWFAGLGFFAKLLVKGLILLGLILAARLLNRPRYEVELSRTYGFQARRNTAGVGLPVPVVYGRHRVFGHEVQRYINAESNKEILYVLYAMSEGPVDAIEGIEINDQPIGYFTNVAHEVRLGAATQTAIPWFVDSRNTYAVGVDLLEDGRSFTYRTTQRIDKFIARVKFPQGITGAGGNVGGGATTITVRIEHKLTGDTTWTLLGDFPVTGVSNDTKPIIRQFESSDFSQSSGAKTPGTIISDAAYGSLAWVNPSQAGVFDGLLASAYHPGAEFLTTHYLKATNLNAGLPDGASPTGVKAEILRWHTPEGPGGNGDGWLPEGPGEWQTVYDDVVRLVVGGVVVGSNKADTVNPWGGQWLPPEGGGGGPLWKSYGDRTDLWGLASLTRDQVNASTFGIVLAARVRGGYAYVDAIRLTVFYDMPEETGGRRDIRITRVSSSGTHKPPMSFDSLDEIVFGSEANTYPNVALLGVKIQASEQLSGDPRVSAVVRGRKVRTLTNGVLSETESWSRNPAECLIDLMLARRYGLGRYIVESDLDLASFQAAKDYCNETVAGGVRHRLDIVLDDSRAAADVLDTILNTFRGYLVESDGKYRLGVDRPTAATQVFTNANIIQGTMQTAWASLSERYDQVEAYYLDEENNWIQESIIVPTQGTKTKRIELRGITRRVHAQREAQYHLNCITKLSRYVEFDAALDALAVDAGDVIQLSHDVPRWGWGGRVAGARTDGGNHVITVDRNDLALGAGTHKLLIRHANDVIEERDVLAVGPPTSSPEGLPRQDITVSGTFSTTPATRDAIWVFGPTTNFAKMFRVLQITLNEDLTRHVVAIEYDETVYV